MYPKEYKDDFLKVSNLQEFAAFQEKYKEVRVKLLDLDDEMKQHLNSIVHRKSGDPNIHEEIHRKR